MCVMLCLCENSRQCCRAARTRSTSWRAAAAVAVNREPQGCEKRAVYERRDRQVSWQHQKDRTPLWPDSVKNRRRGAGTMWPRCGCLRAALSARRCKRQRVRILRQLWSGITGIGKLSGAWKTTLITEQIINQTIICRRIHCVRLQASRSSIDH